MIWMNLVGVELRKTKFQEWFLIVHSELDGKWISAELHSSCICVLTPILYFH